MHTQTQQAIGSITHDFRQVSETATCQHYALLCTTPATVANTSVPTILGIMPLRDTIVNLLISPIAVTHGLLPCLQA